MVEAFGDLRWGVECDAVGAAAELDAASDVMCRGGSAIISPLGEVLAGPLYDREGILYADLDLSEISRGKLDFDAVGHYARPDVFDLQVNETSNVPVRYAGGES